MKKIVIIDGQGGKIGAQLIDAIRERCEDAEIVAVGTNSIATSAMLRSGPDAAATGENPVIVACRSADIIVGPLGIAIADSLMGEISPAMANAVAASRARRVLIPMNLCNTYVAGVTQNAAAIITDAMDRIQTIVKEMQNS